MSNFPIQISKYFYLKKIFLSKILKGKNVECPICNNKFITFLPFGSKYKRANALCISCLSLERHRLIWLYLINETDLFQTKKKIKLLHVSPESCFFRIFKQKSLISYYPVDKFEYGYKYPKGTKNMDITSIEQANDFFDVIICNHVFEHIGNDTKAMSEIYRVLKNDGWAILQVPIDRNLKNTHEDKTITSKKSREEAYGQVDHVRQYGLDYEIRLKDVGFKVYPILYTKKFNKAEKFKFGLPKHRIIYLCKKTGK
jgi:SAM-dependent methyltransferase